MKEIKKELLSQYLDLLDTFEKRIQADMDIAKDVVEEISQDREEIVKKINEPSFKELPKETQQQYRELHASVLSVLNVIESFTKDEQMHGKFSNTLALECCDLLEKLINDKSDSIYVSREDDKEYRILEQKLEGFLAKRKFYLEEGFISYQEYKIAKIESKQKSNDAELEELYQNSEAINEKRQKALDYLRKQQAGELSRDEGRELLRLERDVDRYDRRCNQLEERSQEYDKWIENTEEGIQAYEEELQEIDDFLDYNASSI